MTDVNLSGITDEYVRGAMHNLQQRIDALEGGSGGSGSETITSGASPVAADPAVAISMVTTGGTSDVETIMLANPTDTSKISVKTILVTFTNEADVPTLEIASVSAIVSPLTLKPSNNTPPTAAVQLIWMPSALAWRALLGGTIWLTSAQDILMFGGTDLIINNGGGVIIKDGGNLSARGSGAYYEAPNGNFFAGAAETPAALIGVPMHKLVNGGAAGNITITGIGTDDRLDAVYEFSSGAFAADLTAEFTITASNTINNTSGTNTTGKQLLVEWTHHNS